MSSNYKKVSKLGSGAFATTFLVEELVKSSSANSGSTKQLVMKRVPCKHMRAANTALQEVKVLLSCHHDGIVGYHDFFLDTDGDENIVICLVMEFCDGGDLWEKIATARREHTALQPADVAGWTLQLVSALRYLHVRSILHRDIKPENVFLTNEGERHGAVAKLGDFGLATATEDLDATSAKTRVRVRAVPSAAKECTHKYSVRMSMHARSSPPGSSPRSVCSSLSFRFAPACSRLLSRLALPTTWLLRCWRGGPTPPLPTYFLSEQHSTRWSAHLSRRCSHYIWVSNDVIALKRFSSCSDAFAGPSLTRIHELSHVMQAKANRWIGLLHPTPWLIGGVWCSACSY